MNLVHRNEHISQKPDISVENLFFINVITFFSFLRHRILVFIIFEPESARLQEIRAGNIYSVCDENIDANFTLRNKGQKYHTSTVCWPVYNDSTSFLNLSHCGSVPKSYWTIKLASP